MGVFFATVGLMLGLCAVFALAIAVTQIHESHGPDGQSVTPPPSHVRKIAG
jgi:hypothetical protein